jgi:predicted SAM-dependent methyltransferase
MRKNLFGQALIMNQTIKKRIKPFYLFFKYLISKQKVKQFINSRKKISLELGAGDKKGKDGWITIDWTENCDIFWDLRKGIPFPNESVSGIYSSHFFEHLTFKEGQVFLDECLRVLKSGGTFSICVPDARKYIEGYLKNELESKFLDYKPAYNCTTKIDYINYIAYMDGHHKYMFDEENLVHLLQAKGMKNAHLRGFDQALDLKVREYESIYAIAEK